MIPGVARLAHALQPDPALFALVFALVALSRIPFTNESFGIDPDAWRVVAAAQDIAHFERYTVSRFPGYPVLELAYASLPAHPFVMNGVTVVLSAVAAAALAVLARSFGLAHPGLTGLAFAATPVVYVNSTLTLDYVWAVAFALLGLLALRRRRVALAGLALGLAAGCRISSLLFLVPACLFVLSIDGRSRATRRLARLLAVTLVVAGACFVPAFLRYGAGFLRYYPDSTSFSDALARATLGVWGPLGVLALGLARAGAIGAGLRRAATPQPVAAAAGPDANALRVLIGSGALAFALLFVSLPLEEAYLIPLVPFVVLAIGAFVPARLALLVYALLLLSPFVGVSRRGIAEGELWVDRREKARIPAAAEAILERGAQLAAPSVVIAGPWFPALVVTLARRAPQPPIPDAGMSRHVVALGATRFVFRPDSAGELQGLDVYDLRGRAGARTLDGDFVYPRRHAFAADATPPARAPE